MSEAAAPRPNHLAAVPDNPDAADAARRELVAAIAHHTDLAARHNEAAAAAKQALMKLHGHRGTTIKVGDNDVLWKKPNAAFQKAEFIAAYPPEANSYLYSIPEPVPQLDMSAIPPKLKAQYMRDGDGDGTLIIK